MNPSSGSRCKHGFLSKDLLNSLPDPLLCHILSFLTTKEAASTSILAKRWRYLLAFVPNLELDDSVYLHPEKRIQNPLIALGYEDFVLVDENEKRIKLSTSFPDFVNRVLDLQGKSPLHKFFLKIVDWDDPVDPASVLPWIDNVLARRVSDLHLVIKMHRWEICGSYSLPSTIFLCETLVRLRIDVKAGPEIYVEDVRLPKLKILYLESVRFDEYGVGLSKLLSGCTALEELVFDDVYSCSWEFCSVSSTTLKRLKFYCSGSFPHEDCATSVSFDTPNLVYLEYTEVIANEYPKVKFPSLVETKIDLEMSDDQIYQARSTYEASGLGLEDQIAQGNEENYMVGNVTDFIKGVSNVRILCLSANTLEVLTFCCKTLPIFSHVTHLTIESKPEVGWKSLPGLLKNCPKLETLVFQGLLHRATDKCGDVCLCKPRKEEDEVSSCLSSSLVKVLKILMNDCKMEKQIEQIKYFLETMANLEQVVLYYNSSFDKDVEVSTQLLMLKRVASSKCKVKLIPSNLSVSSTVSSSQSTKWVPL